MLHTYAQISQCAPMGEVASTYAKYELATSDVARNAVHRCQMITLDDNTNDFDYIASA